MDNVFISRYDRHCLDKLLGTSTEARLVTEGHQFTLQDGTEYIPTDSGKSIKLVMTEDPLP